MPGGFGKYSKPNRKSDRHEAAIRSVRKGPVRNGERRRLTSGRGFAGRKMSGSARAARQDRRVQYIETARARSGR